MADFDTLKLNIEANSEEAVSSIDRLITSLGNLNSALNLGNAQGFISSMRSMVNSFKSLSNIGDIGGKVNKEISTVSDAVKAISKQLNIYSQEGKQALERSVSNFINAYNQFKTAPKGENESFYDGLYQNIRIAKGELVRVAENWTQVKKQTDSAQKALLEYVKNTRNVDISQFMFSPDFKNQKKILGKNFTVNRGGSDFAEYIREMNGQLHTNYPLGGEGEVEGLQEAFEKLVRDVADAKEKALSFKEALQQGVAPADYVKTALGDIINELLEATNKVQDIKAESESKDKISVLAESMERLSQSVQTVSLGDFVAQLKNVDLYAGSAATNLRAAGKAIDAWVGIEKIKEAVPAVKEFSESAEEAQKSFVECPPAVQNLTEQLEEAKDMMAEVVEYGKDLGLEFGKLDFPDEIGATFKNIKIPFQKDTPEKIQETSEQTHAWLENLVVVGHELKNISAYLDELANKGIKVMKLLYTPLLKVGEEFREKFGAIGQLTGSLVEKMGNELKKVPKFFTNIQKSAERMMDKITAFFKRSLRTLVFMLVRKSITAMLKDFNEAAKSLASFTNQLAHDFNGAMSLLISDIKYLGANIVAMFAPLITQVAPIIDFFVEKLVSAMKVINQFFAALTGRETYTYAKKVMLDYANATDEANEKQKKLNSNLQSFDKLNVITSPTENKKEDTQAYDWVEEPITEGITNAANKVKDILSKLFEPLKKAWDRAGKYVVDGFKYMTSQLKKLFSDIGRDFLEVWNQEKTVKLFENILRIVGDLERVIGNIAKKLDIAWNTNKVGLRILENIRDIFLVISEHVRNVTEYMIGWSDKLNFYPLLEALNTVLEQMEYAVDQWGYVFEDVMKDIILPAIKYGLEGAVPEILGFIGDIIEGIGNIGNKIHETWQELDFGNRLWANIQEVVDSLLEHVRNVGEAFKEWTKELNFEPIMKSLLDLTDAFSNVADFIGGVFEDIVNIIVLPHVKELTEKIIPGLMDAFTNFIDKVDWDGLRANLKKVWEGFASLHESIDEGIVLFIKDLGERLAEFVNSGEFSDFCDTLKDLMSYVTPEMVENVLMGLAQAIIDIAQALVRFANSDKFKEFITAILDYLNSTTAEDIANKIEKLAIAIAGFKFAAFAGKNIAKFFEFLAVIKSVNNMAGALKSLGTGAETASTGMSALSLSAVEIVGVLGAVAAAAYSFVASFGGIEGVVKRVNQSLESFKKYFDKLFKDLGIEKQINNIKTNFYGLLDSLGQLREFWETIIQVIEAVVGMVGGTLTGAFSGLLDILNGAIIGMRGVWDILGGIGKVIQALVTQDLPSLKDAFSQMWQGIIEVFEGNMQSVLGLVGVFAKGIYGFFAQLKYELIGDPLVVDMWDGIVDVFVDGVKRTIEKTSEVVRGIIDKFIELKDSTLEVLTEWWTESVQPWFTIEKWMELGQAIIDGIALKWAEFTEWWSGTAIALWWEENVVPWFSLETWLELAQSIYDALTMKWAEFVEQWTVDLTTWWDESVAPWFTLEKWTGLFNTIKTALKKVWNETAGQWLNDISGWWTKDVMPWFAEKKWTDLVSVIPKAFKQAAKLAVETFRTACNNLISMLESTINSIVDAVNEISEYVGIKLGYVSLPRIPEISGFAKGGYPKHGELFIANEAGAELIGTMNGRTAVASNNEITGITNAINTTAATEIELLRQQNELLNRILQKEFGLTSREIFKAVKSENNIYKRSTGESAFA